MQLPKLPPIGVFHTIPTTEQLSVLDLLFEPSPALHTLLLDRHDTLRTPFSSYPDLIEHVSSAIRSLLAENSPDATTAATNTATLHAILGSHPRLGAKKVESAQSAAEQARLQQGAEEERVELARLNHAYEAAFPGLRYVVFVNGRGRPEIMLDMRARIVRGDIAAEERTAIQVCMCVYGLFIVLFATIYGLHWSLSLTHIQ
jgi:2-oxo-4-hydroxy-4-carboxy--5-ureidoimidazoline (OHCU) decarboxylase